MMPTDDHRPEATPPGPRLGWTPAPRWPRWPRWAVLLVVAWLGLGFAADALARATGLAGPTCLLKRVTTLPCPTCGSGRGGLRLLHGDVLGALALNPLLFSALALGLALLLVRLATARRLTLHLGPAGRRLAWGALLALALANWIYLIARGV